RVESRCLHAHGETISAIERCADALVSEWDRDDCGRPYTTDRSAIIQQLPAVLDRAGVPAALCELLVDVTGAIGADLPATPTPTPPYVVVSSTGPMVRATIPAGRLVVQFELFAIDRSDGEVRFVRTRKSGRDLLDVTLHD
ncbi:MAG: hypothetical protein ACQETB_13500, partial [Halobacteriota archaeon]